MQIKGFSELEWALVPSLSGLHSLMMGQRSIHSECHPAKEARKHAKGILNSLKDQQADYLVIIGLGLGYLQDALAHLGFTHVITWDPFPEIRKHLLPFEGMQGIPRMHPAMRQRLVHTFNDFAYLVSHYKKSHSKVHLEIHPGYTAFTRFERKQALSFIHSIYDPTDEVTLENAIISSRAIESFRYLPYLPSVDTLKGPYSNHKAILISPGPSLKKCLSYLKHRKEGVIFAAIQTLSILQEHEIKADFIVAPDPNDLTPFFKHCTGDFGALLTESAVHPSTIQWQMEKIYLFHLYSNQLHQILWDKMNRSSICEPIATVSETMLLLALKLNFSSFIFLGMDFSWKNERYIYRPKERQKTLANEREQYFNLQINSAGDIAQTESTYYHAARYLSLRCQQLKEKGFKLQQYTEGIELQGVDQISPKELPCLMSRKMPVPQLPPRTSINKRDALCAREILMEAATSKHLISKGKNSSKNIHAHKRMEFFDELNPEERQKICQKVLKHIPSTLFI